MADSTVWPALADSIVWPALADSLLIKAKQYGGRDPILIKKK
jgi:hypothetical protein